MDREARGLTVYVSIGNSDDKLTQRDWASFYEAVRDAVTNEASRIHGVWFALPNSIYQNMCCCFEIEEGHVTHLREQLADLAREYRQDSIAWAIADTHFIGATGGVR